MKQNLPPQSQPRTAQLKEAQQTQGKALPAPAFDLAASPAQMKALPMQMKKPASVTKCLDHMAMSDLALAQEIKDLKQWLKENPTANDERKNAEYSLTCLEKEADVRLHYDDVTVKAHTQAGLSGDNGEMVRTMLEAAGKDPEDWYKEMVSIQLFGQEAKGIRPEFAAKLKEAEKLTCAKLAEEDPRLSNPRVAKDYLGINESYKTSRAFRAGEPAYQSMHLFGLAIDFNYFQNPWTTQSSAKIKPFKDFTKSVDALFNTSTIDGYSYTDAQTKVADAEALGTIFDGLNAIDKNVELYFSLLDNEELLKTYLAASTSKEWNKLTPAKAKKKIQGHLTTMASQFSRSGGDGNKSVKKHGIMDLDRRLVVSMGEVGLDWGGKYGDMMHFDMRFEGIGKTVNATKGNKKVVDLKKKLTE